MEEQTTWRGHGFTLFVFGGIVFLCATFFVLGMLVGRSQGQKYAANGADTAKPKTSTEGLQLDFRYEDLRKDQPPVPNIVVPPGEEPEPEEPPPTTAREEPPAHSSVNIQLGAWQQRSAAEKLVGDLKKLGFKALIVPPAGADKYYRVQIGPYDDAPDAEKDKQKLEAAGYRTIIKK